MSKGLRRMRLLSRARAAAPLSLIDTHVITSDVWLTDHDVLGHMNNARYSDFLEIALRAVFIRSGLSPILATRRWTPEIDCEAINFDRMMRFPQRFTLETQYAGSGGPYLGFEHVFRAGDKVHARCRTKLHFQNGHRPVACGEIFTALGLERPSQPMPDSFAMLLPERHPAQE